MRCWQWKLVSTGCFTFTPLISESQEVFVQPCVQTESLWYSDKEPSWSWQAPVCLLLSWLCSLHPVLSSSPTKPLWSVCPVSLCLLQMWPGCLLGVQWAVGSLPAPLFSNQTRLSKSAAICPSRRQTGTWIRFTHVKCLWAPRLQRKTSTSQSVPLKNSRGPEWAFKISFFTVCAVWSLQSLDVGKDVSACL